MSKLRVKPRRIYIRGLSVWSVGIVAPHSKEFGWSFGATVEEAYKLALRQLVQRLEYYGHPEDHKIASRAAEECLRESTP